MHDLTAARLARDTGTAQVTGRIVLVQDSLQTPGFLFCAPFDPSSVAGDGSEGHRFGGLVYAPFVFHKLVAGALEKRKRHVGIRVTDQSQLLFDEHVATEHDYDPDPLLRKDISVSVYGRMWTFDIWSAKSLRETVDATQPLTILIAGFLTEVHARQMD